MALDPIWKQQLVLVTYGNEFLKNQLSFNTWVNHDIFQNVLLQFRSLQTQHLLAQHFQIWLENLKAQGVTQLSLHEASLLKEGTNPNPNIELLQFSHFIVAHSAQKKVAWLFGQELAEWYTADNEYEVPTAQQLKSKVMTMWDFELPQQVIKQVNLDLNRPNWDNISDYLEKEIFNQSYITNFTVNELNTAYYTGTSNPESQSLLPQDYHAEISHEFLFKLEQLDQQIEKHRKESNSLTAEMQSFSQKVDELFSKLIVKTANHYKEAKRKVILGNSPFDHNENSSPEHKPSASTKSVIALILITIIIGALVYYFGF
ncbi:hypothetical protein [Acinetobacter pollinis]|jgi:hypothetical protein|uniref:hypothetical protein n=1 Tax=Acinetobacter pollinis TaxID=2605270 RepID=UPI0018A2F6F8|nr:hypothetical protein [Acinetobacter pollinis]MBF7690242.1 hypothetical protein [Acinetobacter pollinis]MBF7693488.1 hypothetical protein [Acinetobacter pollinis]MBF7697674.1 hypothetical protein [Acinetobacter pollinis]MBF7699488.1 hypothetical protein [Acinetobacter pollinis]